MESRFRDELTYLICGLFVWFKTPEYGPLFRNQSMTGGVEGVAVASCVRDC